MQVDKSGPVGANWQTEAMKRRDDKQSQSTSIYSMLLMIVYLCLSGVGAKNTTQSLLRDVDRCCKEALLPSKALWTRCSATIKPVVKCALH